jgi:hypothetical protein
MDDENENEEEEDVTWAHSQSINPADLSSLEPYAESIMYDNSDDVPSIPDISVPSSAPSSNFSVPLRREPPLKRLKATDPSSRTPISELSIDAVTNFLSKHQEHTELYRKQQLEQQESVLRAAQSAKTRRESQKSKSIDPPLSIVQPSNGAVSISQPVNLFDRSVVKPLGFPLSQIDITSIAIKPSPQTDIPSFTLPATSQLSITNASDMNTSEDYLSDEVVNKLLDEIEEKKQLQLNQGSHSVASTSSIQNDIDPLKKTNDTEMFDQDFLELDAILSKAERDYSANQLKKVTEVEDLSAALDSSQIGEKLVAKLSPETLSKRLGAYGDPDITFPLDTSRKGTGPIFLRGIVAEVKKRCDGLVDVVDEIKIWYMCRSCVKKENEFEDILTHPDLMNPEISRVFKKVRILIRGCAWPICDVQPGDVVNIICLYNGRDAKDAASLATHAGVNLETMLLPIHPDDRISKLLTVAAIYPPNYFVRSGAIVVDDVRNALIVHPDVLVAPTKINYATSCKRKALMGDASVDMGSHGPASGGALVPLMGNMKHQVFQFGLRNGLPSIQGESLKSVVKDITSGQKTMLGLYAANQNTTSDVQTELQGVGRGVEDWLIKFGPEAPIIEWNNVALPVQKPTRKNACFSCGESGHFSGNCPNKIKEKDLLDKQTPFRIKKVIGIEEQMWSPVWGIKGVIDATAIVEFIEAPLQFGSTIKTLLSRRIPLEIKTGNRPDVPYSEHKAQILLYDLLMQERDTHGIKTSTAYASPPAQPRTLVSKLELPQKSSLQNIGGILIYLSNREEIDLAFENLVAGSASRSLHGYGTAAPKVPFFHATHVINAEWNEQRHLIILRNEIASLSVALKRSNTSNEISRISPMPPVSGVIDGERTCSKCYQFAVCAAHYVANEIPTMHTTSDIEESLPFEVRHRDALSHLDAAGMGYLFKSAIQHVEPHLAQYVHKWLRLTELEGLAQESRDFDGNKRSAPLFTSSPSADEAKESKEDIDTQIFAASYTRSVFWRESSDFREKRGQGIGGLVLLSVKRLKGDELQALSKTSETSDVITGESAVNPAGGSAVSPGGSSVSPEKFAEIFIYTLETVAVRSLENVDINIGEWVILSGEGVGPFGLLSGYVTHLDHSEGRICVQGDRNAVESLPEKFSQSRDSPSFLWRLDRDDIFTSSNVMRENLLMLLLGPTSRWLGENFTDKIEDNSIQRKTDFGDVKRQRLIVKMEAPKFDEIVEFPWTVRIMTEEEEFDLIRLLDHGYRRFLRWRPQSEDSLRLKEEFYSELNPEQQRAIELSLRSQDYSLILGMPGTGKTATTAFIVRCLVALGQSVLITSHTHTAVDNLLLKVLQKLSKEKVSICRIGRVASVKSSLREFCLEEKMTSEINDLNGLHSELTNAQVVGTTSLAIKHVVFSQRKFDVCIVDEAGQILEPVALGPLRTCNRFVMIGDHHQLPPLVKSESAKKGGMNVSLFKRLAEKHPMSVAPLTMQYRMNADIMTLSNMLVYGGRLRCGSLEVQNGTFIPPLLIKWRETNTVLWLNRLLDPKTTVLFVNTDSAGKDLEKRGIMMAIEEEVEESKLADVQVNIRGKLGRYNKLGSRSGGGTGNVFNEFEADRVAEIVNAFILAGSLPADMCVISPYNAQVKLIRGRLNTGSLTDVDVDTVDRFQGQDRNIVIFSFVRSNTNNDVGALLADIKRLNVAITRPKQKFVLIGSATTLSGGSTMLCKLIEEGIKKSGWMIDI